jgi:hypothetical protein
VIVATAGAGWAMAADAATFAASALCLWLLRVPPRATRATASFLSDLREGWDAFRGRRWVWTFVLYAAGVNTLWGAWSALGPVVADRDLGGAAAWGAVLGSVGIGALFGSLLATRARPQTPLVFVLLTEAVFALPLAFLAAGASTAVLACAAFLSGAGLMLGNSVWDSTLQRHVPAESLSRVSAYDWFGSLAFYPIGLAIWGPLAGAIGVSTSLWLAFVLFIALICVELAVPDTRRLRAEPSETTG